MGEERKEMVWLVPKEASSTEIEPVRTVTVIDVEPRITEENQDPDEHIIKTQIRLG